MARPARDRWNVRWLGEADDDFHWRGDTAHGIYRDRNATACVTFGLRMAAQVLQVELRQENEFLQRDARITRRVGEQIDLRGSDLSTRVISCLDPQGRLSRRRRDPFAPTVPQAAFELVEQATREVLADAATPGTD